MQVTHWNQWRDFELQQDARITDALCERWRVSVCLFYLCVFDPCDLHIISVLCVFVSCVSLICVLYIQSLCHKFSGRLTDLSIECVENNIPASTDLCQSLLKTLKLTVTNQTQREERHVHTQLQMLREQLQRCRQVLQSPHDMGDEYDGMYS